MRCLLSIFLLLLFVLPCFAQDFEHGRAAANSGDFKNDAVSNDLLRLVETKIAAFQSLARKTVEKQYGNFRTNPHLESDLDVYRRVGAFCIERELLRYASADAKEFIALADLPHRIIDKGQGVWRYGRCVAEVPANLRQQIAELRGKLPTAMIRPAEVVSQSHLTPEVLDLGLKNLALLNSTTGTLKNIEISKEGFLINKQPMEVTANSPLEQAKEIKTAPDNGKFWNLRSIGLILAASWLLIVFIGGLSHRVITFWDHRDFLLCAGQCAFCVLLILGGHFLEGGLVFRNMAFYSGFLLLAGFTIKSSKLSIQHNRNFMVGAIVGPWRVLAAGLIVFFYIGKAREIYSSKTSFKRAMFLLAGLGLIHRYITKRLINGEAIYKQRSWSNETYTEEAKASEQPSFRLVTVLGLFAELIKADGECSAEERQDVIEFINISRKTDVKLEPLLLSKFDLLLTESQPFTTYVERYRRINQDGETKSLSGMITLLVKLAACDGPICNLELQLLRYAASEFQISQSELEEILQEYDNSEESSTDDESDEERFLRILGLSANATNEEIKRAFRDLANKYHPDKIAGKDVPPEFVDLANEKFKEFNSAYEGIREARGF